MGILLWFGWIYHMHPKSGRHYFTRLWVNKDWLTPMQVEYRFPPASVVASRPAYAYLSYANMHCHLHRLFQVWFIHNITPITPIRNKVWKITGYARLQWHISLIHVFWNRFIYCVLIVNLITDSTYPSVKSWSAQRCICLIGDCPWSYTTGSADAVFYWSRV